MCVNCSNINCNSCSGISSTPKYTSEIKFDGGKYVCTKDCTFNNGQSVSDIIYNLSEKLCSLLNPPDEFVKSINISMPPNNYDIEGFLILYGLSAAVIERSLTGVGGSVSVVHDNNDTSGFAYLFVDNSGILPFPFMIDRNTCNEDITVRFINMPAGFSQGGGDGIIASPFSIFELPSDVITLDWDNTVPDGTYLPILEIATVSCGTVEIPYCIIVG